MFGIVGTIPEESFPVTCGPVKLAGDQILIGKEKIAVKRGTPAMIAAASVTLSCLGKLAPYCYLVGDIGDGVGCKRLYRHLIDYIPNAPFKTLALHYFQPDVGLFKELLAQIKGLRKHPTLIADAGFMYVAKMSGEASSFDLFTPDAGELAYLADEEAPHPFYTRGFILHEDNLIPDLIERAYRHNNAASFLLVKGARDYIANKNGIIATIDSPMVEALEAIGGTGDTLTGIVSAMIASGLAIEDAATMAAKVNRWAGYLSNATPATQIHQVIREIPRALKEEVSGGQGLPCQAK